jgi:hypothetical protein
MGRRVLTHRVGQELCRSQRVLANGVVVEVGPIEHQRIKGALQICAALAESPVLRGEVGAALFEDLARHQLKAFPRQVGRQPAT